MFYLRITPEPAVVLLKIGRFEQTNESDFTTESFSLRTGKEVIASKQANVRGYNSEILGLCLYYTRTR
jgi:hypothetical protein